MKTDPFNSGLILTMRFALVLAGAVAGLAGPAALPAWSLSLAAPEGSGEADWLKGATALSAVNTPPTISDLPDQLIQMNTTNGPLDLVIGDGETAAEELTLSATSSNLTLVPLSRIEFGGAGSNRTVTITPAFNRYGKSLITISVSDGTETNSESFVLTVNSPPVFLANNPMTVNQGGGGVVTSTLLRAGDAESGPERVTYKLAPLDVGGIPHFGWLRLRGTNLTVGDRFTQQDINDGLLTYQHDDGCGMRDDFGFDFSDGDGGVSGTGGYSFKINVTPRDDAPVTFDGAAELSLGGSYAGTLSASNLDCLGQPLTFRIVTNGTKGTLVLTNAATGDFVYMANPGETGQDTVYFQVSDGGMDAASPGAFTFSMRNTAPTVQSAAFEGNENRTVEGLVTGDDIDLPAQTLSFSVVSPPTKGTVVFTNGASGGFVYTPLPGRFGADDFTFQASDGGTNSAPATVTLVLRPEVLAGRVMVNELGSQQSGSPSVKMVDRGTGDVGKVSEGGYLAQPMGLAWEQGGTVLVTDFMQGLIRFDPRTGVQELIVSNSVLPNALGVAVEGDGNILATGFGAGLARFSPQGVLLTNFPGGNLMMPAGVVVAANGDILVSDAAAVAGMPEGTDIVRIDSLTLTQTVITSTGLLAAPASLAIESNGNLLVADVGIMLGGENKIIRVDPDDGTQTLLSSGGLLTGQIRVAASDSGEIFVSTQDGQIIQIDPVTGAQTPLALEDPLSQLIGIMVVPGRLPAPEMINIEPTAAGYRLGFRGVPGKSYELQRSTVVSGGEWNTLDTQTAPISGVMEFEDRAAPAGSSFYRARQQ